MLEVESDFIAKIGSWLKKVHNRIVHSQFRGRNEKNFNRNLSSIWYESFKLGTPVWGIDINVAT